MHAKLFPVHLRGQQHPWTMDQHLTSVKLGTEESSQLTYPLNFMALVC